MLICTLLQLQKDFHLCLSLKGTILLFLIHIRIIIDHSREINDQHATKLNIARGTTDRVKHLKLELTLQKNRMSLALVKN